jgi:hypothetical protein
MEDSPLQVARLEPLLDEGSTGTVAQGMKESGMRQIVEGPCDIHGYHPLLPTRGPGQKVDLPNGIVAAAARPEPVAAAFKPGFPPRFEGVLDLGLEAAIKNTRDAEGPETVIGFGNVYPSDGLGTPRLARGQGIG